ncbi:MAG: family 20 glycosylhydrolase, partial [Odoribacter sp.]|nr:family 20 glycosylhydrolase [Odoribacter sp.]
MVIKLILFWGCLFLFYSWGVAENQLLPLPQKCVFSGKPFAVGKVRLQTPVLEREFRDIWKQMGGVVERQAQADIVVKLVPELKGIPLNRNEAYRLNVTSHNITVEAETERGVYWAVQTLRQLAQKKGKRIVIPGCAITDWPAFRIRGFMQDVGRTYISMEELKREIAVLSRFKINVFHWHLTENQAWRLESRIFPVLNDSANMTRCPGKYYTLE